MVEQRDFLTAAEVMAHLRMGRTFVYQEARRYLATDGASGIPCRKFGRLLRFPASELHVYATTRPSTTRTPPPSTTPRSTPSTNRVKRPTRRRASRTDQPSLFEA